ncbi:hypothetical protein PHYBLDRAFT_141915 [Phycomyces blakesleeanus NRRL 1555(-)]|uniref:Uncharacterized protein n=1 Tax=Phycomyces blakesleeanus (strain ATCC 8743b / DSM 1359 / FGSC 10004 / NBRC 33097 / NRRL 1555) TaxID=763407 RepID=A0A162UU99_PHYB8|nr:hypothetical protein PHYBLDRAFT_141915 [Phycomyces blakesleeanus NRRL 1555(-)]OAD78052.1 hypothetical protein PHYBLDRAFT_141915 [Phycomyces blakesleeanus NRRL 1555(-)]|eukprot:XP_018296092.1 hypothetical protein PHYBLDRAFT_141915 [Phycomyces blakesleeanus NRRL 1555(-)]
MTQAAAPSPSVRYIDIARWIAVAEIFQELPGTLPPGCPMSQRQEETSVWLWGLFFTQLWCVYHTGKWTMFSKGMLFPISRRLSALACNWATVASRASRRACVMRS